MQDNCLFCRIVAGEVSADVVYSDEIVTAFRDIQPQASTHILVIPNAHVTSLNDAGEQDSALLARLLQVSSHVAREEGIHEAGYRVVTNVGRDAGQSVFHLHFHVLGGNRLRLPLG